MKLRTFAAAMAVSVAALGGSVATASAGTLNGAGCTFCEPIWKQLGADLKSKGLTLNYAAVGSGSGVTQFINGTVDFAGSDPPLTDAQLNGAEKAGPVVHIPIAFGAITVSYNVPGVKAGLRLDGPTVANIYLGKITKWNDAAIKRNNKNAKLPDLNIRVCRRSDSSGTTAGFTTFLGKYSSQWVSTAGAPGNTAKWPVGTGAQGNAGVAGCVKQATGGIGYVEQAFAIQNKFTYATVKNRRKQWIYPRSQAVSIAGSKIKTGDSLRFTTIDNPSKGAYPIVSQTFMINHRNLCAQKGVNADKASDILGLINYIFSSNGSKTLKRLLYAPIPADLKKKVTKQVKTFNCNGSKVAATRF